MTCHRYYLYLPVISSQISWGASESFAADCSRSASRQVERSLPWLRDMSFIPQDCRLQQGLQTNEGNQNSKMNQENKQNKFAESLELLWVQLLLVYVDMRLAKTDLHSL